MMIFGLDYKDVEFLSAWSERPIYYHAVFCANLGHSSPEYARHLETLFDVVHDWRAAGGETPIPEHQKIFPPPSPKRIAKAVPGRVPSIGYPLQ